jgi:hypothetical protein
MTMAVNLIAVLEQVLGSSDVVAKIAAFIGLSPERTKTAIGGAVPAILAGLVGLAQKPAGRDQLAATVRSQDPSVLDGLSGMLSGGRETSLSQSGSTALTSLFGQGTAGSLAGAIGRFAGLDQTTASSLLGVVTPAVMGVLGREQRAQGLNADGLANLLNDQKDSIAHALPSGLASTLGSTGLLDGIADRVGEGVSTVAQTTRTAGAQTARTASSAAAATTGTARQRASGGGTWRWAIGALAALAVIWGAYHFLFRGEVQEAVEGTTDTATQVGEDAQNLVVGDVNVGQEVTGAFESATTALNGITDAASAEAALPKLTEIDANLDKLGGLVEQLPAEGKSALVALINGALPALETLIAKVNDMPGVGPVIKPTADAMVAKLKAMVA